MSYAAIHPDWEKPRRNMVDGYSLEMTAKELNGLREAAPLIRPKTQVAVTFLPGEEMDQRVEAAKLVRELGFEPIVHISARRLTSKEELDTYLSRITSEAGVRRYLRRPLAALDSASSAKRPISVSSSKSERLTSTASVTPSGSTSTQRSGGRP